MSYALPVNTLPSKIIYLDSRDASTYLATNEDGKDLTSYFQYILNEDINIPPNQRALVSLNSASIPYSFYNIRTGINDQIYIEIYNVTKATNENHLITLDDGNYTAYTLADALEKWIDETFTQNELTFTMEFSTDRLKYQYRVIGTGVNIGDQIYIVFSFHGHVVGEFSPYIEMGFDGKSDAFVYSTEYADDEKGWSDNVCDLNGSIHGVYIRTNLVQSGTLDSQNGTFSNILARLPINVNSGGLIFAQPVNATHKSIVDLRTIGILTIRLTDERNRILDLNGLHFQIAISVDFVYAEKPFVIPDGRSKSGNSFITDTEYGVSTDITAQQKLQRASQQAVIQEQLQREQRRSRRGPGRPRRVGRPKKRRTKIEE